MINNINTQLTIKDKTYQVNWDLQQVNILVGNNGSGKTRLLEHIAVLYKTYCFDNSIGCYKYTDLKLLDRCKIADYYESLVESKLNDFHISMLSTGQTYLLNLLTNLIVCDLDSTILIDDIEQNLDLGTQQKLLDFLVEQRPDLQFIVTTHSPSIFGKNFGSNVTFINNILIEI